METNGDGKQGMGRETEKWGGTGNQKDNIKQRGGTGNQGRNGKPKEKRETKERNGKREVETRGERGT
jgi:hypothetical protein